MDGEGGKYYLILDSLLLKEQRQNGERKFEESTEISPLGIEKLDFYQRARLRLNFFRISL
jgi:hypothetical protein